MINSVTQSNIDYWGKSSMKKTYGYVDEDSLLKSSSLKVFDILCSFDFTSSLGPESTLKSFFH